MRQLKFGVIILILGLTTACHNRNKSSQTEENSPQNAQETLSQVKPDEYAVFNEGNALGVKNSAGEIIVPARYNDITYINDIIIAKNGDSTYFFNGDKQIFRDGVDVYSIEDKFITCYNNPTGLQMLYFFKTGVILDNMPICTFYQDAIMCEMPDHSFAFYTYDGHVKADNLKKIICLQKLSKEGWVKDDLFVFSQDDSTEKLIYDTDGNLKHEISLTTWQNLGMTYLTRVEDDDREYEYTYSYRINLEQFIYDAKIGKTRSYYPEED